jgi:hypothetical protein
MHTAIQHVKSINKKQFKEPLVYVSLFMLYNIAMETTLFSFML